MHKSVILLVSLVSVAPLRAADPVLGYGLTNFALGQATLEPDYYGGGTYRVTSLGSNGLDGVSILLGEPDAGVFLTANSSYLQDGNFMIANAYGQLNGSHDQLLATIQGGRASETLYPLRLDFSPLGPESVTYQVFYQGALQREFSRGSPMVSVQWGYLTYPTLNPISRRSDGSVGMSLAMSQPVSFVFPEILRSAQGDELFIRLNHATNQPGLVTRMEIFGGGNLYDFWFNEIGLGVFGRRHRSLNGATLQAAPNRLRVDNFLNTNSLPGVVIQLERLGGLTLEFDPFHLAQSNSSLVTIANGSAAGNIYTSLGTLTIDRHESNLTIGVQQSSLEDLQIVVLANAGVVSMTNISADTLIGLGTNALIGSITAHAKTTENLPGFHVRFTQPIDIRLSSNAPPFNGDELRLLLPYPARMEHLHTLYLSGRYLGAVTITNEIASPQEPAPRLHITRAQGNVILNWADPNRLFELRYADEMTPYGPFFDVTIEDVVFSDPYAAATVPIIKTNAFTFFELFFSPQD